MSIFPKVTHMFHSRSDRSAVSLPRRRWPITILCIANDKLHHTEQLDCNSVMQLHPVSVVLSSAGIKNSPYYLPTRICKDGSLFPKPFHYSVK